MRKRAQRKSKPVFDEPKHVSIKAKPKKDEKPLKFNIKKNSWITITLIGIFLLVLFFNTFYNSSSEISINPEGEGFNKFYLSGPDPYYNMRLVEETYKTGRYPFYAEADPLLNFPLERSGGRAPLFNMMALGFSRVLTPFMDEIDAVGYSMQFIPALFGALLIFPVYFIGKEVFNKKAGLIGALFVALIPIHISSGHGSAYSLFDHDSFNLLIFFITFLFIIKGIKEKDSTRSLIYSVLAGVSLAALSMTWVMSRYLYVVIAIYAIVQMFMDIFRDKIDFRFFRNISVVLFSGYLLSLPVITAKYGGFKPDVNLFICLAVVIFGLICCFLRWRKIPWTISLPSTIFVGVAALVILHPSVLERVLNHISFMSPLKIISNIIYGSGIYGNKVSMTIAEANTYEISHTVMSFGPALYWLAWAGLIFLMFYFYRNNKRRDYLFVIVLFIISLYLTFTAGRFINDMVPIIALLAGWIIWMLFERIDYKQMIRDIRSAGGGFHGIRRGVNFLHVFGILFIAFLVLLPNAFIAFDAAVPVNAPTQNGSSNLKEDMFGEEHSGAFGLGIGKERYWGDAFRWLNEQDNEVDNPNDRPAFISWWDYGFYEVAMGGHPTVADNFQDGIPPASNFHTATSEQEAVAVWIVRLLEGDVRHNNGKVTDEVKSVLEKHLGVNNSDEIVGWIEDPTSSPSYLEPIQDEYHEYIRDDINDVHLLVGAGWDENAAYHDIVDLLTNESDGLSDEEITQLYHDLQNATGWSIRYYGVEGYDKQIFNIFAFLSDKSLLMIGAPKDDFVEALLQGYELDDELKEKPNSDWEMTLLNYLEMPDSGWISVETTSGSRQLNKKYMVPTNQDQTYLDAYFDTMFYRTYFGPKDPQEVIFKVQLPCSDMKHFYAEYISDLSKIWSQYYSGIAAVVIAKYYEGAIINGTVLFDGKPIAAQVAVSKNLSYSPDSSFLIDHDKTDTINGSFEVIAGADSIIQIRRYPELDNGIPWYGTNSFVLKEINLNISDKDAMRKSENWQRNLGNVTIEPANANGYVYDNLDDNDTYNLSADEPIPNADVLLYEILEFDEDEAKNNGNLAPLLDQTTFSKSNTTDGTGYYNFSNLKPGYYVIETKIDDIPIDTSIIPLYPGNITINISKPKLATVEGTVYDDLNSNNKFDENDKIIDNADVSIFYKKPISDTSYQDILINSTETDNKGYYKFGSLVPGKIRDVDMNQYVIKISKLPTYESEIIISPDENKTTMLNISAGYAPVTVSGLTKYDDEVIGNIDIQFIKNETEKNNSAVTNSAKSNETTGFYQVDLMPGDYNVTVKQKSEQGNITIYFYESKLKLEKGEETRSNVDILLQKKSVTVNGITTYNDLVKNNISLTFQEKNNSEIFNTAITDENGQYTLELKPGSYNITAESEIFDVDGINYTYIISEETNELINLNTDLTFNVKLEMKEAES